MRLVVVGLALVASLGFGAEPGEATAVRPKGYQLDAPFQVVQDGKVLLELPRGVVMPQESFDAVDAEFVRLQKVEQEKVDPVIWFIAGAIVASVSTAGLLGGLYLITR